MIKLVTNPYPMETLQARIDHARVTGQPLVERPYWFENEKGHKFHDIFGCIGWPSEVNDRDLGLPGYAAILGIVRPFDMGKYEHYDPKYAKFVILEESEDMDVPALLRKCVDMRKHWGYGVQDNLLSGWYGDPDRFLTTLGRFNERLEKDPILIVPPEDFYTTGTDIFDVYVRSLRSALHPDTLRLYFTETTIVKGKLREFTRDDPAIFAMGGLIHTLLGACMWMDQSEDNIFRVEEAV